MKAAWYENFGPADKVLKLGDWVEKSLGHGEVRIQLRTSAVNPSDTKKRAGVNASLLDAGPVIPHSDGAGTIVEVGDGVDQARIGERVWVYNGQYGRQEGTAAEYINLPADQAIALPDQATFEDGAMMAIPAMTAHRCVFADGPIDGQTILVTGGAGRVGHYAVQWAKQGGAKVIATASNDRSKKECILAGADLVVPHPSPESGDEILTFNEGKALDRIVEGEFGGNVLIDLDVIKTGGVIASYASMSNKNPTIPFYRMMYLDLTVRLVIVYAMPREAKLAAIADITQSLTDGKLINRVAASFPLEDIAAAHQVIEKSELYGCVLTTI